MSSRNILKSKNEPQLPRELWLKKCENNSNEALLLIQKVR